MYIVTGASFGIGRAVAAALASRGLRVAAVARSADLLDSLAAQCHRSVTPVVADLATDAGIGQVVAATADESGIEGLVHSAGSLAACPGSVSGRWAVRAQKRKFWPPVDSMNFPEHEIGR
jgi:short-subunit dehydrogenase